MKQLKARARAEEAVYANKQTSEFLAHAAGLRRLGEWAAEHMMGEGAPAVRDYADTLVRARVVGVDVVVVAVVVAVVVFAVVVESHRVHFVLENSLRGAVLQLQESSWQR